jgi:hypothetical protein
MFDLHFSHFLIVSSSQSCSNIFSGLNLIVVPSCQCDYHVLYRLDLVVIFNLHITDIFIMASR